MNKRSGKTKRLSHRLLAVLLCCVCVLAAMPAGAVAFAADAVSCAEESVTEQPTAVSGVPEAQVSAASSVSGVPEAQVSAAPAASSVSGVPEAQVSAAPAAPAVSAEPEVSAEPAQITNSAVEPTAESNENEPAGYAAEAANNRTYTIVQGGTQTVSISNMSGSNFGYSCTEAGITASLTTSGYAGYSGYTISVGSSVPAGTYTMTVTYDTTSWSLFDSTTTSNTDTVTITVTEPDTSAYTFTVTPNLSNVDVVYFAYHTAADVANAQFISASNGNAISIPNFSYNQPGYIVFFVKPSSNHLLVNAKGSGNNDVYSVQAAVNNTSNLGNIAGYPGIAALIQKANALGYIGVLGFSRAAGDTNSMSHTITQAGQSPDITVTAASNKTENVKPGDNLTFTVTITPGKLEGSSAEVKDVTVESLKVNGKAVTYTDLVKNSDGSYTTTVSYTATGEDCSNGSVVLDVTANVKYSKLLGVSDDQSLSSSATIEKSARVTCLIAPKSDVTYRLTYVNAERIEYESHPDIIKTKPANVSGVYTGQTVPVESSFYTEKEVDDPVNHGKWSFTGWYYKDKVVDSVTMGEETIYLDGYWTFTPYPNADLTIRKTVSGNMQDSGKEFTFTVAADKAMNYHGEEKTSFTFQLKKNEEVTISVPVGAAVTVSEEPSGYTYSLDTTGTTITNYTALESGNGISFTMPEDNSNVVFNNEKNITVDTGVILDTLPYVLILAVVVIGALVLMKRRRNRDD